MKTQELVNQLVTAYRKEKGEDPDLLFLGQYWYDSLVEELNTSHDLIGTKYCGLEIYKTSKPLQIAVAKADELPLPAVHVSGVISHQECPRRWLYSNGDWGYGYKSVSYSYRIDFGTWMHFALALTQRGYTYDEAVEQTLDRYNEMQEILPYADDRDEMVEMFRNLMKAHLAWQKESKHRYADRNLEYLSTETQFETVINDVYVAGQWDGLVRHIPTGRVYVLERKTTANPERLAEGVQWDFQPRLYTLAAEKYLGEKVDGVIYEIIRTTDPYSVKMLKSGLPSKAKSQLDGTTYEVYTEILDQCIEEQELDRDKVYKKYQDALDYISLGTGRIFTRTLFCPTQEMKRETEHQLLAHFTSMVEQIYLEDQDDLPHLNRHKCGYCGYRTVCLARDDGLPWQAALADESTFGKRDERFDDTLTDDDV